MREERDQAREDGQTVMPPERATAMETPGVSQHSPLPWTRSVDLMRGSPVPNGVRDARRRVVIECGWVSHDDAELIVRAVNSHEALVSALKKLTNEVGGFVGICELEMREAAGNTNVNVLMQRLDEARAALALTEGK